MPLTAMAQPAAYEDTAEGVVFRMLSDAASEVTVRVSLQALEEIDAKPRGGSRVRRFNEYRNQFEQIASEKYDKGHIEQDGSVCIRGRDLPGRGQ